MSSYKDEVNSNFDEFTTNWLANFESVRLELAIDKEIFKDSYLRIVSLNAWRTSLLKEKITTDSLAFFMEAQNDALVSHTLAQFGCWRAALKALRSCIENVLSCLYFKDHPVELQLWSLGKYKLGFTDNLKYISEHPEFIGSNASITGIEILQKEYSTLSKAVHASGSSFRMTPDSTTVNLWSSERSSLNQWKCREKLTLHGINTVLLVMFRKDLEGARLPGLRQALQAVISRTKHSSIKSEFGVNLT